MLGIKRGYDKKRFEFELAYCKGSIWVTVGLE